MTLPRVTVLMAVRDGAAHLEAQLHSIAAQRGVDWRLVASDDGSGDDSPAFLARFAAAHPGRVQLTQGPRQGATANFLALLAATGADDGWLAFSDQDDIWLPDKLARATAAMRAAEVGLWTAQVTLCDESGRVLGPGQTMPERPDFGLLAVEALAGGNTMVLTPPAADLLRRALAITPADLLRGVYHDWWAAQVVAAAGGALVWEPQPCLLYRQHEDAQVGHGGGRRRARRVLGGGFGQSLAAQLRALQAAAPLLRPEARALIDQLAALPALPFPRRLIAAQGLPVRRRTPGATLALRLALALGMA
ncbi:MAG: glycosyltransferase [Fuscovulum sp.]|nr:glycosyltransferase [Fuscovulum sp.]